MAAGSLTLLSGSQSTTGTFATVKALTDSDITVSGSNIGALRFVLGAGQEYTNFVTNSTAAGYYPANEIQSVSVNNSYGTVVLIKVPTA
jgi:hypothetical protein